MTTTDANALLNLGTFLRPVPLSSFQAASLRRKRSGGRGSPFEKRTRLPKGAVS